jgi:hypothetical protein
MKQGFLFYRVDGKSGRMSVPERIKFTVYILTNIAKAGLIVPDCAVARTERAEDFALIV